MSMGSITLLNSCNILNPCNSIHVYLTDCTAGHYFPATICPSCSYSCLVDSMESDNRMLNFGNICCTAELNPSETSPFLPVSLIEIPEVFFVISMAPREKSQREKSEQEQSWTF